MNEKVGVVYQLSLKTANRKQQNRENVFWFVENCDIKLEILHKHNPFEWITGPDNCDVRVFFFFKFFTRAHNFPKSYSCTQKYLTPRLIPTDSHYCTQLLLYFIVHVTREFQQFFKIWTHIYRGFWRSENSEHILYEKVLLMTHLPISPYGRYRQYSMY